MTASPRSSKPTQRKAARRTERPVPTFDHLRAKKPIQIPYWVPMDDGEASRAVQDARQAHQRAELLQDEALLASTQAELDQAEANLREHSIRMLFRGMGRYDFEALVAEHPPTEAQKAEARAQGGELEYNYETIAAPLIAGSCVEPKLTVEQVELLQRGTPDLDEDDPDYVVAWNQAEFAGLFQAALRANTSRRDAELGF